MSSNKNSPSTFDMISVPLMHVDINHKVIAANPAACRFLGKSRDEIIGGYCYNWSHDQDKPCWKVDGKECPVKSAIEHKKQIKAIHSHKDNGRTFIEQITATPVYDNDGKLLHVLEEWQDLTHIIQEKDVFNHIREELHILRKLIPICSSCKKVRDDNGFWQQVEQYITEHSDASFTHGCCPDCVSKIMENISETESQL